MLSVTGIGGGRNGQIVARRLTAWTHAADRRGSSLSFILCLPALIIATACNAACDTITTFADGLAPSRTIHVATDGSDTTGDGSPDRPYATISRAAADATPGSAIRLAGGVYSGGAYVNGLAGTEAAPVWIGGEPGEDPPVLQGGGEGMHLVRARYVVVQNLEVRDAAHNGINADDGGDYADPLASHHLIFQNLYIHDIGDQGNHDGLKLSGINDFHVLDCEITRCGGDGSGSGIDHVGCHHGLIARCSLHHLSANAVQCKGGSEDIEVRWCRLEEAGARGVNIGGSTGFEYFRPPLSVNDPNVEARDIRVLCNVIEGCWASVAFVGCVECVVANNTIVDPHNWILRILQETTTNGDYEFLPCGSNRFESNLVFFDRSDLSTYVNTGPNTAPETFTFANNLWYAHDNPAASAPTLPVAETDGIYGEDPRLADAPGRDYRIDDSSPAAAAGLPPAPVDGDINETCYRPPPSIGAFEVRRVGDVDGDGMVDLTDHARFAACMGGPTIPVEWSCRHADLDEDGTVDLRDWSCFQREMAAR